MQKFMNSNSELDLRSSVNTKMANGQGTKEFHFSMGF